MAKSIRSKCKRKARAEFRRTIGEDFHKKNLDKIQDKLQECVEKQQSLKSYDRLSTIFSNAQGEPEMDTSTAAGSLPVDVLEVVEKDHKGENKAPAKKSKRSRKHGINAAAKKTQTEGSKRRPKYFVKF